MTLHPVLLEAQRWEVSIVKVARSHTGAYWRRHPRAPAAYPGFSIAGTVIIELSSGEAIIETHRTPDESLIRSRLIAQQLMHEITHVVVGVPPNKVNESLAMTAIEHEAMTRLRLNWRGWAGYFVSRGDLDQALDRAYADAIKKGLMTPDRKPTYVKRLFRRRDR